MEQDIITPTGGNNKLLSRQKIDAINPKLTIVVPETHTAILVKDGQMLQTLSSGKYRIADFVDAKADLGCSLEVLFMSKTAKLKLLWGTANKVLMYDAFLQENYHVGFSGDFEVQIGDPRKCFLYLVGAAEDLTADALQERLMSNVVAVLESVAVEYVKENKISFNQIVLCKRVLSEKILSRLSQKLNSEYGIAVFSFNIANIIIDEQELAHLTADFKAQKPKEESENVCRNCGAPLPANAKFCPECGAKVSGEKICPNCHAENFDEAKFFLFFKTPLLPPASSRGFLIYSLQM